MANDTEIPTLKPITEKVQKLDMSKWGDVDEAIAKSDLYLWDGTTARPDPDDLTPAEWVADLNYRAAQADKHHDDVVLGSKETRAIVKLIEEGFGLPRPRTPIHERDDPMRNPDVIPGDVDLEDDSDEK